MDDYPCPAKSIEKERILTSCRELSLKWAKAQFTSYVNTLEERIFKIADKAANNEDQTRHFQSRDEIKLYEKVLQRLYAQHIYQAFDNYRENKPTTADFNQQQQQPPQDESQLTLVDNSELEETLAIASMSRKASATCSEEIYTLNQRFSALRSGTKMNEQGNPIAPGVFGEALQHAITELTLDGRSRLIFYKVFDAAFMSELGKLYALVNHHCERHGVLPNLSYTIKKKTSEAISEQLPEELQGLTTESSHSNQLNLMNAIQQLQAQLQPPTSSSAATGNIPVAVAQIIAGLQPLQINASDLLSQLDTPQAVADNHFPALRQQAELQAQKYHEVDSGVIEVVGLLFEYMLSDHQLPDSIKALLSYLHTPILKIALLDKDFFNHPEHPARQLFNSMVAAGERWVEPTGQHKNNVFLEIKKNVERLLIEFDDDVRLFSKLVFEFNHYLRQHSRRIRLAEKRSMQAASGENKLKEIRFKVDRYLKQKINGMYLPTNIQTLLFEPWANFMSFNLLRFGSHSEQWRQAAQAVDDILWYCQAHSIETDSHARKRIEELQQSLPNILQHGFDTVGFNSSQGLLLLKTLNDHQHTASKSPPLKALKSVNADIDQIDTSQQTKLTTIDENLVQQFKQMEAGSWFEFNAASKTPQRVKLAWSNTHTLHFMFVNRMGQQVAVKTGQQLADGIHDGSIKKLKTLDTKPFFEKGMEQVLEKLQQREQNSS